MEEFVAKTLKVILFVLVGVALLLGGFSGGFVVGAHSATPWDLQTLFKPFWETWQIIHTDYVDQPVDNTKLLEGAITGMVQALGDPHSEYMDPQVYKDATTELNGSYAGIGAYVDTSGTVLTIIEPIPGSPAEKAGLLAGDQIIAVDGVDMTGVDPVQVRSKVVGPGRNNGSFDRSSSRSIYAASIRYRTCPNQHPKRKWKDTGQRHCVRSNYRLRCEHK